MTWTHRRKKGEQGNYIIPSSESFDDDLDAADAALIEDANREMELPEDGDYGDK